jgi:hypothetical protein
MIRRRKREEGRRKKEEGRGLAICDFPHQIP